jgi:hypothetical protein
LAMRRCSSLPILYFFVSLFFKFFIPSCLVRCHRHIFKSTSKSVCKSIPSIIVLIALIVMLGPALLLLVVTLGPALGIRSSATFDPHSMASLYFRMS